MDLGICEYGRALDIQHDILAKIQKGELPDTLLFVEHPHVLTMGRRARNENIYADAGVLDQKGIKVFNINRGGDVTYHGYGQLVGYPVFNLEHFGKDIKDFVFRIESAIMACLKKNHGIEAGVESGRYTGVWVGGKKICAIGIGVKRWVSYHGFAYNINTDLEFYKYINPCGLGNDTVTSLEKLIGNRADFEKEKQNVLECICEGFSVSYRRRKID